MIEMNYSRRELNIGIGIIWILASIMNAGMFLYMLFESGTILGIIFGVLLLLTSFLESFLGLFYIRLDRRVYVSINNGFVSVDRGLVRSPFEFHIHDIENARLIGDKLRFQLKTGRNYRIMTSSLSLSNVNKLQDVLDITSN